MNCSAQVTLTPSQAQQAILYNTKSRAMHVGWYQKFTEVVNIMGGSDQSISTPASFAQNVASFQEFAKLVTPNLLKVDGKLGPRTWQAMQQIGYGRILRCYMPPAWLR